MVTKTDPKAMAALEKPGVLPPPPPHDQKGQNSYERYGLGIDNDADRRLTQQSHLTKHLMGDKHLPDRVIEALKLAAKQNGGVVRIADVGTGPGDWLFDVADELRDAGIEARLEGYDLFAEHFPPLDKQKGTGIYFHVLNIHDTEGFSRIGPVYDLVHIRYMSVSIGEGLWERSFANLLSILKPGGTLQWEEIPLGRCTMNDPGKYPAAQLAHQKGWHLMARQGIELLPTARLSRLFENYMQQVTLEEWSTYDVSLYWQGVEAEDMTMAYNELVKGAIAKGPEAMKIMGIKNEEEGLKLVEGAVADFHRGACLHLFLNRLIGRKPGGKTETRQAGAASFPPCPWKRASKL